MAAFTLELREIVQGGRTDLGLSRYPIFDENYREYLNDKIIQHFWYHEIGFETVDVFIHQMHTKMCEIMPYFNQLYKSELLKIEPFVTHRSTQTNENKNSATHTQTGVSENSDNITAESTTENSNKTGSKARAVAMEFPQTRLAGNEEYANQGTDTLSEGEGRATGSAMETRSSTGRATSRGGSESSGSASGKAVSEGFSGSMSQLLSEYRSTFLNIDMMVIEELQELFMSVYSISDSFTEGNDFYAYLW